MALTLLVDGDTEYVDAAVLNAPLVQVLTESGYAADGSDFAGFVKPGGIVLTYSQAGPPTNGQADARRRVMDLNTGYVYNNTDSTGENSHWIVPTYNEIG